MIDFFNILQKYYFEQLKDLHFCLFGIVKESEILLSPALKLTVSNDDEVIKLPATPTTNSLSVNKIQVNDLKRRWVIRLTSFAGENYLTLIRTR